jgi:hypothetical protein
LNRSLGKPTRFQQEDDADHRQEPDDQRADSVRFSWMRHPCAASRNIGNAKAMPGAVFKQPAVIAG